MVTVVTSSFGNEHNVDEQWHFLGQPLNYYPGHWTFTNEIADGFRGSQLFAYYDFVGSGLTYDSHGDPGPDGILFAVHWPSSNFAVSGFALKVSQWNAMSGINFATRFLAGNDVFRGGAGNDVFSALGGNDSFFGNGGRDVLNGGAGNDRIDGGLGDDKLNGGDGDDTLIGRSGADELTGGRGRDIFVFNAPLDSPPLARGFQRGDTITDFVHGQDKITLTAIDANTHKVGNQAFHFLAAKGAAFTHIEGELRWYHWPTTTIIEGDMNGDARADFTIVLNGHKVLTAIDFHL